MKGPFYGGEYSRCACFHPFVLVCFDISLRAASRAWGYAVQGLITSVFDDTAGMSGANQFCFYTQGTTTPKCCLAVAQRSDVVVVTLGPLRFCWLELPGQFPAVPSVLRRTSANAFTSPPSPCSINDCAVAARSRTAASPPAFHGRLMLRIISRLSSPVSFVVVSVYRCVCSHDPSRLTISGRYLRSTWLFTTDLFPYFDDHPFPSQRSPNSTDTAACVYRWTLMGAVGERSDVGVPGT